MENNCKAGKHESNFIVVAVEDEGCYGAAGGAPCPHLLNCLLARGAERFSGERTKALIKELRK